MANEPYNFAAGKYSSPDAKVESKDDMVDVANTGLTVTVPHTMS
jgi:hypothetical protein